jgi:hypothetical protein
MREFFRGWKRKLGMLMLVTACAFTVIWVRAHRPSLDRLRFRIGTLTYCDIMPCRDGVLWERARIVRPMELNAIEQTYAAGLYDNFAQTFVDCHTALDTGPHENESDGQRFQWKWQCCGFQAATVVREDNQQSFRGVFWFIPHGMIVLPLAAISAWLLFSKPRSSKKPAPTHPTEPDHA